MSSLGHTYSVRTDATHVDRLDKLLGVVENLVQHLVNQQGHSDGYDIRVKSVDLGPLKTGNILDLLDFKSKLFDRRLSEPSASQRHPVIYARSVLASAGQSEPLRRALEGFAIQIATELPLVRGRYTEGHLTRLLELLDRFFETFVPDVMTVWAGMMYDTQLRPSQFACDISRLEPFACKAGCNTSQQALIDKFVQSIPVSEKHIRDEVHTYQMLYGGPELRLADLVHRADTAYDQHHRVKSEVAAAKLVLRSYGEGGTISGNQGRAVSPASRPQPGAAVGALHPGACNLCGETGHFARACPTNDYRRSRPQVMLTQAEPQRGGHVSGYCELCGVTHFNTLAHCWTQSPELTRAVQVRQRPAWVPNSERALRTYLVQCEFTNTLVPEHIQAVVREEARRRGEAVPNAAPNPLPDAPRPGPLAHVTVVHEMEVMDAQLGDDMEQTAVEVGVSYVDDDNVALVAQGMHDMSMEEEAPSSDDCPTLVSAECDATSSDDEGLMGGESLMRITTVLSMRTGRGKASMRWRDRRCDVSGSADELSIKHRE